MPTDAHCGLYLKYKPNNQIRNTGSQSGSQICQLPLSEYISDKPNSHEWHLSTPLQVSLFLAHRLCFETVKSIGFLQSLVVGILFTASPQSSPNQLPLDSSYEQTLLSFASFFLKLSCSTAVLYPSVNQTRLFKNCTCFYLLSQPASLC